MDIVENRERRKLNGKSIFLVYAMLVPPYAFLSVSVYWYFIDNKPPMTLIYQHDKFSTRAASTREEARASEATEADSGSRMYLYREICAIRPVLGISEPIWQSGSIQWSAPQRTFPPRTGCYQRSFEVLMPVTNPARPFEYNLSIAFENNPLVTSRIQFPGVTIFVRAQHSEKIDPNSLPSPNYYLPKPRNPYTAVTFSSYEMLSGSEEKLQVKKSYNLSWNPNYFRNSMKNFLNKHPLEF